MTRRASVVYLVRIARIILLECFDMAKTKSALLSPRERRFLSGLLPLDYFATDAGPSIVRAGSMPSLCVTFVTLLDIVFYLTDRFYWKRS